MIQTAIESLEDRRLFSILQGSFSAPQIWAGELGVDLSARPVTTSSVDGDLDGDGRVDLADFKHFQIHPSAYALASKIKASAGFGDANTDGRIDQADFDTVRKNFNAAGDWSNGDFTMNGQVNLKDYALAAANLATR